MTNRIYTFTAFMLANLYACSTITSDINPADAADLIISGGPAQPLFTMWSAVNRVSRSGQIIGADQRITPEQVLKSITLDGAWQYFEEDNKGSIADV